MTRPSATGSRVILPFELNQDYDYSDPAVKARFREQITAWVLRYRDHPAVLMWGPGNEVMHRLIFPTAVQGKRDPAREKRADDFAAFYVELIDMIHQLDPNHPVVYRDAEDLYFARLREALLQDGERSALVHLRHQRLHPAPRRRHRATGRPRASTRRCWSPSSRRAGSGRPSARACSAGTGRRSAPTRSG